MSEWGWESALRSMLMYFVFVSLVSSVWVVWDFGVHWGVITIAKLTPFSFGPAGM